MENAWDSLTKYTAPAVDTLKNDWDRVTNYLAPKVEALKQSDWGGVLNYGAPAQRTEQPAYQPTDPGDPWGGFQEKAKRIAAERNYPAGVLLGQAALETARGSSNFARQRNNYFGYQAYDSDPNQAKGYATQEDSINDYIDLIQNTPRYSWAYQQYLQDKDPGALIANIRKSGYATDPNYVQKVMSLPEFSQ